MAIKRFEELDKVESLKMSKCEMESVVARALVAKKDARIDLLTKELESQRAQFELAALGAKLELASVQQRMLATTGDISTPTTAPSVINPTWVLLPGTRAPHLNVPVVTTPRAVSIEVSISASLRSRARVQSFTWLTPSWPRRSNRRPKHVFYYSTAYTIHSPV